MISRLFQCVVIVIVILMAAPAVSADPMSPEIFNHLLPRISCKTIRMTGEGAGDQGKFPDPTSCLAIITKFEGANKQFWASPKLGQTMDGYSQIVSLQAGKFCQALLQANQINPITGACDFDVATAETPLFQYLQDAYAHGALPDGAQRGSICSEFPKPARNMTNDYLFSPVHQILGDMKAWDNVSAKLKDEGFTESFSQKNAMIRLIWGISLETKPVEQAALEAPLWFTVYVGPKSVGFLNVLRCEKNGGTDCAQLQAFRNLQPDHGLCLEMDSAGP